MDLNFLYQNKLISNSDFSHHSPWLQWLGSGPGEARSQKFHLFLPHWYRTQVLGSSYAAFSGAVAGSCIASETAGSHTGTYV